MHQLIPQIGYFHIDAGSRRSLGSKLVTTIIQTQFGKTIRCFYLNKNIGADYYPSNAFIHHKRLPCNWRNQVWCIVDDVQSILSCCWLPSCVCTVRIPGCHCWLPSHCCLVHRIPGRCWLVHGFQVVTVGFLLAVARRVL